MHVLWLLQKLCLHLRCLLLGLQVYIVCSLLLFSLPMFIPHYTESVKIYLLPYLLPVIHVALVGSVYSTVALAVERYITVCHPFIRYRSVKGKVMSSSVSHNENKRNKKVGVNSGIRFDDLQLPKDTFQDVSLRIPAQMFGSWRETQVSSPRPRPHGVVRHRADFRQCNWGPFQISISMTGTFATSIRFISAGKKS